ncbi:MAG: hybrid sensor histidine kinase/response regulator [Methanomicrobiales archaeon HGW-Methanomicrobiales-4]|nr:MAG: hybrid sensor histidine kinase/response regulator [Methanomicrobiales archaeon HGW-Methanomicrobiales-4]
MVDEECREILEKILVVEDNRTQAEYLRFILKKSGYQVLMASNGFEAIEIMKNDRPDLILTDIVMPEMDGYELCESIKKDKEFADIPVILVTHLYDPVDVIRGLEAGADNFIIKPYDPECINSRIISTFQSRFINSQDSSSSSLLVNFADATHTISADRRQILNILLSTYEIAVKNYSELQGAHDELNILNDKQHQFVEELQQSNDNLVQENIERQRVEAALAMANNKLQLMSSITRHDLLNQMNSLQGYLDLALTDRMGDPENAWSFVEKAIKIVEQTVDTVKFTDEYQNIGINHPIWQDIRVLVQNSIRHTSLHHIRLENLFPENNKVYADPLIEKVFSNLIENSVKYGKKNSVIRFRIEENASSHTIICEDDGIGVPADEKEKIFTYQYGKNTGLGLFLSREILAITGITIRETGIEHEGARFEIFCPVGTIRTQTI